MSQRMRVVPSPHPLARAPSCRAWGRSPARTEVGPAFPARSLAATAALLQALASLPSLHTLDLSMAPILCATDTVTRRPLPTKVTPAEQQRVACDACLPASTRARLGFITAARFCRVGAESGQSYETRLWEQQGAAWRRVCIWGACVPYRQYELTGLRHGCRSVQGHWHHAWIGAWAWARVRASGTVPAPAVHAAVWAWREV